MLHIQFRPNYFSTSFDLSFFDQTFSTWLYVAKKLHTRGLQRKKLLKPKFSSTCFSRLKKGERERERERERGRERGLMTIPNKKRKQLIWYSIKLNLLNSFRDVD